MGAFLSLHLGRRPSLFRTSRSLIRRPRVCPAVPVPSPIKRYNCNRQLHLRPPHPLACRRPLHRLQKLLVVVSTSTRGCKRGNSFLGCRRQTAAAAACRGLPLCFLVLPSPLCIFSPGIPQISFLFLVISRERLKIHILQFFGHARSHLL